MKHLNEALKKSMIKKLEKHDLKKYYVIIPFKEIEPYLAAEYKAYRAKSADLRSFIVPFDKIIEIIEGKIAPGYFVIYEPKFNYNTQEDIGKEIKRHLDYFENTAFFEKVYQKIKNGDITINKYNW